MRKALFLVVLLAGALVAAGSTAQAAPTLLSGVPSYDWYHGCVPTAGGQLFGYWDTNGYTSLFNVDGAALLLTSNVQDEIASPGHIADYWGIPDPLAVGHTDDSIADFMGTSRGTLNNGWSYISDIDEGIEDYATFRGYGDWTATNVPYGASAGLFDWAVLVAEIDANRPLLLSVDSSGDGGVDHTITGIGYEDRGLDGLWYASYNTWHEAETVDWYQFRGMSGAYSFGIYNATLVLPGVIPAPGALLLGLIGTGLCVLVRKRTG